MGYVTLRYHDGETVHYGDGNPNRPAQGISPLDLAKLPYREKKTVDRWNDPEVREPGDFSYEREG